MHTINILDCPPPECDENELAACEGPSYPTTNDECTDGWMGLALYYMDCTSKLDSSASPSGEICYNGTIPGSFAAYKCNTGFQLEQDTSTHNRSCLPNGFWSGVALMCTPVPSKSKLLFLLVLYFIEYLKKIM